MATYSDSISPEFFPDARRYTALCSAEVPAVREPARRHQQFPYTERHLQCAWYDPALRPLPLKTSAGEDLQVDDPGTWNLQAGPDFLGASVRIGPDRRMVHGDVEIHVEPSDWKAHGHQDDPRYRQVRLHVTYFAGTIETGLLPPGTIEIALRDQLKANPYFSFDAIDLTSYPYAAKTNTSPCAEIFGRCSPDEREAVLDAAGQERLRRKAERMATAAREKNPEQVLYEETMCALGYQHNKEPFRYLAEQVPIAELRAAAEGDHDVAYAILMGVAGLLPRHPEPTWDGETRDFVRKIWDIWWRRKEPWESRALAPGRWTLAGIRPANHPRRRLMAGAQLFTQGLPIGERLLYLGKERPALFIKETRHLLENVFCTFWDHRVTFHGDRLCKEISLIGESRAAAIVTNVFVPYLAAMNEKTPFERGILDHLPIEAVNSVMTQTAHVLFGPDHSPHLYHSAIQRQGLLQIFYDFCLSDRSGCSECGFPRMLESRWTRT